MPALPESIGKYRVISRLGEGGMGTVYLAHDDGIDRDVAIKLLRTADEATRRRFQSEAQSAGRLKHSNIVTVYEYGEFEGEPYIIMEYVAGRTLAQLVELKAQPGTATRVSLLIQACTGLAYAHRAGVVHRDIKPSNLMVDGDGVLKIVDFGIARTSNRDLTMTGKVVGTPAYMAPEQIRGDATDHRSDIFSLGLVVFELLSGQCAFTGDSDYAVINRIVTGQPNPFRHPVAAVEALIRPVIDKALANDPGQRYLSADSLAEDLDRVRMHIDASLDLQPPQSSSDTAPTIVIPPLSASRPRRAVAVGAVTVAVVVAVALIAIRKPAIAVTGEIVARQPAPVSSIDTPPARQPAAIGIGSANLGSSPQNSAAAIETVTAASPSPAPKKMVQDVRPHVAEGASVAPILTAAKGAMAAADYDTAIARFTQVLALDQLNAAATDGIAAAQRAQERVRAASVKARVAEAEQKLLDGNYDDAIAGFEAILKGDAANPDALDGVARARRAKAAEDAVFKSRIKKPSGVECA